MISSENICNKEWVYRQYDHEVGVRSIVKCGEGDSGVLRIIGTNKFIAASVGTNSKHCFLDPYNGAKEALVEECDNVIANGAIPKAMVNCCNFGNPEIPESFWYFAESVRGMADGCQELRIPVVGGNVSFYNEDEVNKTAIKATPEVMIVGIIEGYENIITLPFKKSGDDIYIIGDTKAELGGSEYHSVIHEIEGGNPPNVNLNKIKSRWDFLFKLYEEHLIKANHDVNKGGFVITIAEMCFKESFGANIDLEDYNVHNLRDDELLFSESVGRFIIEVEPSNKDKIFDYAKKFGISLKKIGEITKDSFIKISGLKSKDIELDVKKLNLNYKSTIPHLMEL